MRLGFPFVAVSNREGEDLPRGHPRPPGIPNSSCYLPKLKKEKKVLIQGLRRSREQHRLGHVLLAPVYDEEVLEGPREAKGALHHIAKPGDCSFRGCLAGLLMGSMGSRQLSIPLFSQDFLTAPLMPNPRAHPQNGKGYRLCLRQYPSNKQRQTSVIVPG